MRILVTTSPPLGHVLPVVPLAQSLAKMGHEVRWATGADAVPVVETAGIECDECGASSIDRRASYFERYPEAKSLAPEDLPSHMFPRLFGGVSAPAMIERLLPLAERWQPDLMLNETGELAAPIVASRLGVPHITHSFGSPVPAERLESAAEFVAPLWHELGFEVPPYCGVFDDLYLDIYPRSMQFDEDTHVRNATPLRPVFYVPPFTDTSSWEPDVVHPRIYVTFGTVFNEPGPVFRNAVEASADVGAQVLVTVGHNGDVHAFDPLPRSVTVLPFVPQSEVLDWCDVVMSHAGSGTFLGAITAGVPQLCLPQAADQFRNAAACERTGVGMSLGPAAASADAIRDALRHLLAGHAFHDATAQLATEIASMPHPDEVAAEITDRFGPDD
jgi:UDP:flavonoid glycosyltransferase YjiC (YdhE family)